MNRILIMLIALSLSIFSIKESNARTQVDTAAKLKQLLNEYSLSNNSLVPTKQDNTLTITKLMPAKENVSYVDKNFSTPFNYPRLLPQGDFIAGASSLTDQERKHLQKYITAYYEQNGAHFRRLHAKSDRYFKTITKILAQYGVPEDLKYLAVIESNLNTNARSYVGAVGAWQFMASTARFLGLTVNANQDDRTNLYKSTVAAAKYLNQLHDMFNSWILVIAAYNSGPGRVQRAISSSKSKSFWDLKEYLPRESQNHVMKFLATSYIMNRFAHFFGVEKENIDLNLNNPSAPDYHTLASISLAGKYSLPVIAKYISMDLRDLKQLNPDFTTFQQNPEASYTLHLPADKMIQFKANQNAIINSSINLFAKDELQ